jgi:hypothetical protein
MIKESASLMGQTEWFCLEPAAWTRAGDILFAVTEFLGTGSQVPLLLVIDAI